MSSKTDVVPSDASLTSEPILQHEINQVETCFKNAASNVAKIYKHQSRSARLSSRHASGYPPAGLTRSLALQVEKYDAFCDIIELELAKSIAVIRRELQKEQAKQLQASQTAMHVEETQILPLQIDTQEVDMKDASAISPSVLEQFTLPNLPFGVQMGMGLAGPLNPVQARRPSTVSLSSLRGPRQGAPFPLKLDLSSTALRLDDPAMIPGLFSPVTLAPRTARPPQSAIDSDIIHSFAPADAGMSESDAVPGLDTIAIDIHGGDGGTLSLAGAAGSDQLPLALDLGDAGDMESLFGDVSSAVETTAPELPTVLSAIDVAALEAQIGEEALFTPDEVLDQSALTLPSADLLQHTQRTQSSLSSSTRAGEQPSLGADFDLGLDFPGFSPSLFDEFGSDQIATLEGEDMDLVQQLLDGGMPST